MAGTYIRTPETKEKLRLALERRRRSGEQFGFKYGNNFSNKSEVNKLPIINECMECFTVIGKKSKRCKTCHIKTIDNSGSNHPRWRGGISSENQLFRQTIEYKAWRKSVFNRDNYTCQICNNRSSKGNKVRLNADHIKSFADYPELRLEITNGRTLYETCHKKTATYGWKHYQLNRISEYNQNIET